MRIGNHRIGLGRAVFGQDLVEVPYQTRADQDVVRGIALLDERDADGYHVISERPARLFTARASTNNRSDSRLRQGMMTGLMSWSRARVTTDRSARRQL